eukprot:scpid103054/ scgid28839/ 
MKELEAAWHQAAKVLGVTEMEGDVGAFVSVDDNVFTEKFATAEELLHGHAENQSESDCEESDEEEPTTPIRPKPTWSEASVALQTLVEYIHSVPDSTQETFAHTAALNEFLVKRAMMTKQSSIKSFFFRQPHLGLQRL